MSKHFFAGYSLILLFVSINVLSMDDNKSFAYSKNSKKEKQGHKDRLFTFSSSIADFKQQSIVLQNNNANPYSLVFNRNHP